MYRVSYVRTCWQILGPKMYYGSLHVSVFEFASGKGFYKSVHFNPQTYLTFRYKVAGNFTKD